MTKALRASGLAVIVSLILATLVSQSLFAQAPNGSIELIVKATPTGGLDEPVRGFPLYLLSKSFRNIRTEADSSVAKPDMDAFIEKLGVSKELKAWMKKHHWVQLSGEAFIHKVSVADTMEIKEFFDAYLARNSGYAATNFPKAPKYKTSEAGKDSEKAKKAASEYREAIRRYIEQNPNSLDGMDLELAQTDPSSEWAGLEAKRDPEIRRVALSLAQSRYLVARTETNLQGESSLSGIRPGDYWLSTLDVSANVGDARLYWDTPVTTIAGRVTRVALSNINAIQDSRNSP